jgi:hypothetical protein
VGVRHPHTAQGKRIGQQGESECGQLPVSGFFLRFA